MRDKIKMFLFVASMGTFMIGFAHVQAGSLTPLSLPAATGYTLNDIYKRLTTGVEAVAGSHDFAPTTTPQSVFHTLSDIYNAIPSINAAKLLSDTTYLGVTGSIDIITGDNDASSVSTSSNKISLVPSAGYYDGVAIVSTTTSSFTAASIKLGEYIFGIIGSLLPSGGNATAADVASGKTFFGANQTDWTLQTGTYVPSVTYPGRGWTPNGSGDGSTALSQAACEAAAPNWYWFEDGNGDGDTTDSEDGICVQAAAVTASLLSWNGSEQVGPAAITAQTATGGSANTIVETGAGWTVDAYADAVVKVTSGTASGCWGVVKSNTTDTITVYGSWLSSTYASSCGTPDETSVFAVEDDGFALYDNSWIGDWTCAGNFPSGTVSWGSYPTTAKAGSGNIALAVTDCYDGKRDLLPNESDRAVVNGTVTATSTNAIGHSSQYLNTNGWVGQKLLITGGTGSGSWGRIESNTDATTTVSSWSGAEPDIGSTFSIIYLIPHATYNPNTDVDGNDDDELNGNNGPLTEEKLKNWKGTKLPDSHDFFGFCGYKDGGLNYENTTSASSSLKYFGNYGGQVGRTDEFLDLANSGSYEWLSEQHNYNNARIAGSYACSYFTYIYVHYGHRFRAVFRP